MGKRRKRKRDRWAAREAVYNDPASWEPGPMATAVIGDIDLDEDTAGFFMAFERSRGLTSAAPACGNCREFLGDENGGRGECLHPGSGVLRPWTDTAPCPFWHR